MAYQSQGNSIEELIRRMSENLGDSTLTPPPLTGRPRPETKGARAGSGTVASAGTAPVARASGTGTTASAKESRKNGLGAKDYPLTAKHPELIKTLAGKPYEQLTLDNALKGEIGNEDIKISPEVLEYQAQIAENSGKKQLAENFRRASELASIPDDEVLRMYNLLRPNRATKKELLNMADELREKYNAPGNADLVLEAAAIYEKRGILLEG